MKPLRSVCAWCPPTPEILALEASGEPITHGICADHADELLQGMRRHRDGGIEPGRGTE